MSNINLYIKLDDDDLQLCKGVAQNYVDRASKYTVNHTKFTDKSFEMKLIGAKGELAVSKLFGYEWAKMQLETRLDGDVGPFEVKSTEYPNGNLLVETTAKSDRDYIFCIVNDKAVKLVGWRPGSSFFNKEHEFNNNLPRPCYRVMQSDLYCMSKLIR